MLAWRRWSLLWGGWEVVAARSAACWRCSGAKRRGRGRRRSRMWVGWAGVGPQLRVGGMAGWGQRWASGCGREWVSSRWYNLGL